MGIKNSVIKVDVMGDAGFTYADAIGHGRLAGYVPHRCAISGKKVTCTK